MCKTIHSFPAWHPAKKEHADEGKKEKGRVQQKRKHCSVSWSDDATNLLIDVLGEETIQL